MIALNGQLRQASTPMNLKIPCKQLKDLHPDIGNCFQSKAFYGSPDLAGICLALVFGKSLSGKIITQKLT